MRPATGALPQDITLDRPYFLAFSVLSFVHCFRSAFSTERWSPAAFSLMRLFSYPVTTLPSMEARSCTL